MTKRLAARLQLLAQAEAAYARHRARIIALDSFAEYDRESPQSKAEWIKQFIYLAERNDVADWSDEVVVIEVPAASPSCALTWERGAGSAEGVVPRGSGRRPAGV